MNKQSTAHLIFFLDLVPILTIFPLWPTWYFFQALGMWTSTYFHGWYNWYVDGWECVSPCLQWWIILVCSRCFWTCYPVSFLTGASFWQMIAARRGVLPQVLIFPGCLDIIILETATLLMSLALQSSAQRRPSLAYQMLSLKMLEVWESIRWMDICVSHSLRIE